MGKTIGRTTSFDPQLHWMNQFAFCGLKALFCLGGIFYSLEAEQWSKASFSGITI
jgi:hypothetical protein